MPQVSTNRRFVAESLIPADRWIQFGATVTVTNGPPVQGEQLRLNLHLVGLEKSHVLSVPETLSMGNWVMFRSFKVYIPEFPGFEKLCAILTVDCPNTNTVEVSDIFLTLAAQP